MTDLHWLMLLAIMTTLYLLLLFRPRNLWSDSDHYALAQKYSDAASALTAMKAELDKLQERLEFSEDVRYSLGMKNAKLANEIEGLNRDAERGEEARLFLLDQLNIVINDKWRLEDRLKTAQRSLRIARHKEFKRWKKHQRRNVDNWWPHQNPAPYHNSIRLKRDFASLHDPRYIKSSIRESINILRTLEPYPLP